MPRKPKPTQGDLISADEAPRWIVSSMRDPDVKGGEIHTLYYGDKRQLKGKTPADLARFRQIADHSNRRGFVPRPKILCRADENLPVPKHHVAAKP